MTYADVFQPYLFHPPSEHLVLVVGAIVHDLAASRPLSHVAGLAQLLIVELMVRDTSCVEDDLGDDVIPRELSLRPALQAPALLQRSHSPRLRSLPGGTRSSSSTSILDGRTRRCGVRVLLLHGHTRRSMPRTEERSSEWWILDQPPQVRDRHQAPDDHSTSDEPHGELTHCGLRIPSERHRR